MRALELFAGIGGFALAWERLGFEHVAFVEIDRFCRAVLAEHWPEVPQHADIRRFSGLPLRGRVDLVSGGPPCQPASVAGKRGGHTDARWLWGEFLRVVGEVSPRWVVAENPLGLVSLRPRGLEWVIGELESQGFEVWPVIVGAQDVGAPHERRRVFIVGRRMADADSRGGSSGGAGRIAGAREEAGGGGETAFGSGGGEPRKLADPDGARDGSDRRGEPGRRTEPRGEPPLADASDSGRGTFAGASSQGGQTDEGRGHAGQLSRRPEGFRALADADSGRREGEREPQHADERGPSGNEPHGRDTRGRWLWPARRGEAPHEWEPPRVVPRFESGLGYVSDGFPPRVASAFRREALKALGNSVVPQNAELIGRAILAVERGAS